MSTNMENLSRKRLQPLRDFVLNMVAQANSAHCGCQKPPSLLLLGPSGVGKTYLMKQMSNICDMPLRGNHVDQMKGPQDVRKLFVQARECSPSIVFLDDLSAIAADHNKQPSCCEFVQSLRNEIFAQLGLPQLVISDPNSAKNPTHKFSKSTSDDESSRISTCLSSHGGISGPDNESILVVAATNKPWLLYSDHEMLSRFRGVYLVGLPDLQTRCDILRYALLQEDLFHNLNENQLKLVAEKIEGYTPADIMMLVKTLKCKQYMAGIEHSDSSCTEELPTSESPSIDSSDSSGTYPYEDGIDLINTHNVLKNDDEDMDDMSKNIKDSITESVLATFAAASGLQSGQCLANLRKLIVASALQSSALQCSSPLIEALVTHASGSLTSDFTSNASQGNGRKDILETVQRAIKGQILTPGYASEKGDTSCDSGVSVPTPDSAVDLQRSSEDVCTATVSPHLHLKDATFVASSSSSGVVSIGCDSNDSIVVNNGVPSVPNGPVLPKLSGPLPLVPNGPASSVSNGPITLVSNGSGPSMPKEQDSSVQSRSPFLVSDESLEQSKMPVFKGEVMKNYSNVISKEESSSISHGLVGSFNKEVVLNKSKETSEVTSAISGINNEPNGLPCDSDTSATFELFYEEPPEPMRNDNKALDSDSDNELVRPCHSPVKSSIGFEAFSGVDSLTVEIDHKIPPPNVCVNDIPPGSSGLSSSMSKSHSGNSENVSGILKTLLSSRLPLQHSSSVRSFQLESENDDEMHGKGSLNNIADPNLDCILKKQKNVHLTDKNHFDEYDSEDLRNENKTSTPVGLRRRTPCVTPTPSELSSCPGGTLRSSSSAGDSSPTTGSSDNLKKGSSSTLDSHGNKEGNAPSEVSTATIQEPGENQNEPHVSDTTHSSEDESGSNEVTRVVAPMHDVRNVREVLPVTLADFLSYITRNPAIAHDEIKRFTDFMTWFGSVAKSACPHGNSGSRQETDSFDEISVVDSTLCDSSIIYKKRKGKLKKLGQMLLKALLFILD